MQQTLAALRAGIDEGLQLGAQIYVSRAGEVLLDEALGESAPGVPMTRDTINVWMSAGKPLLAVAFAKLWEEGKLTLDEPVARWIPEFAQGGKATITPRHILTHTGGFIGEEILWQTGWDEALRIVCAIERPEDWLPGQRAGYHPISSWYVLGELIQRAGGEPLADFVRKVVFEPAGMDDTWMGMPTEQFIAYGARIGQIFNKTPEGLRAVHSEAADAAVVRPGSNARGPLRALGKFYEALLHEGRGPRGELLRGPSVAALTARHRVGMLDSVFRVRFMDSGLGFFLDGKWHGQKQLPYGFGPAASTRTFGHGGVQSTIGFCDPEHALCVAWIVNGMPGEAVHQRRNFAINAAIYADLGIEG